jgi:hypothetical protein
VLGLSARRHYRLAPRSDDAVGAAMLGQGAGEIAAVAGQWVPLWCCKLDWGRADVSCLKSDEISEPFGRRFSGDLTGFGRCVTGINRADTANVNLDVPMLRHLFVVCNSSGEAETEPHAVGQSTRPGSRCQHC